MFDELDRRPTISLGRLAEWFNSVRDKKWMWVKNSRCKYVVVKVDTRSGAYCVLDQDNIPISEQELFWQYSKETPVPERGYSESIVSTHDATSEKLVKALNAARGWVLTAIDSPTAKKDLKLIDEVMDILELDISCTCLSDSQDDAYEAGGPMSGHKRPPPCKAKTHIK